MLNTQANEYRNVPLSLLRESSTNPRRTFEEAPLRELADSIRVAGVLSPLLVRPVTEQGFEIVFGARRFRAAQLAEAESVPVRIVVLADAEALEAQLIENLQRRDVHPMEEAQGFRALLNLEEPKYSIEQIAAKTGKLPSYVAQRLRLTELTVSVAEAFYAEEIGVGHALLLAKLQPDQQEKAMAECFREEWPSGGQKGRRTLLPVRVLQQWIERHLMLALAQAPFNTKDTQLVPEAGSCVECPKRTGRNCLLFSDVREDACTDPTCYATKVEAHVRITITAKPQLVQISTSYGTQQEGSKAIPRNRYTEINPQKPDTPQKAKWPEYKTCRYTSEAIVTDGIDKGELRRVCANPECPVHHPKKERDEKAASKAEQDKRRREEAIANAIGLRILTSVVSAVPVRLMKRDLLFVAEHLLPLVDEQKLTIIARNRGIQVKKGEDVGNLLTAYLRSADESALGRLIVETVILAASRYGSNATKVLRNAATLYKVDVDAVGLKVKQEFAAKDKAKKAAKAQHSSPAKKAA